MAMKELLDRDCGGINPLMKLASQITSKDNDAKFKQARVAHDDEFSAEFLAEQRPSMAPVTFSMDGLLQELQDMERSNQRLIPGPDVLDVAADSWAAQFLEDPKFDATPADYRLHSGDVWAGEFLQDKGSTVEPPKAAGNLWAHEYLDLLDEIDNKNAEFEEIFSAEAKNKSPTVKENLAEAAQELLDGVETSDPKLANSEFIKFVKQLTSMADGSATKPEKSSGLDKDTHVASWENEFTSSLDRMERAQRAQEFSEAYPAGVRSDDWVPEFTNSLDEAEELTEWYNDVPHDAMAEKWAAEFTAEAQSEDFWSNLQKQWELLAEEDVEGVHDWLSDYNKLDASDGYTEYRFEEDNSLQEISNPFDEGLKRLSEGDISSAVLLFEAAVKKNPQHAEAWQYLGTSQAANEHDRQAIAALRKCLELDGKNLSALLSLAVSYTNESMQRQACDSLASWLNANPLYSHLFTDTAEHNKAASQSSKTPVVSSFVSSDRYNEVRDMLLRAVQATPDIVDPDVQVGLGTVFSLGAEYDKAVDCFTAALQVRPEDSLIWNKLGASLANGRRSEEAVDAYRRALDLSPGYVRTRYNLGVACINLGAYREAMEHFLTALSLQQKSISRSSAGSREAQAASNAGSSIPQSTISETIWSSLRTTLVFLNRADLLTACDQRNFDVLNKEFNNS